ncbi:MAG TPA: S66 peptidase family protein [Spirochaetia bacterium]|nr:S66 peptidase family protein [Spirochaetia bacterium]
MPRLERGDRIAIISPSSGLAPSFPGVYERGLDALRSLGLEPVELPTARMTSEELYKNPRARAIDLKNSLRRDDIQGVISVIGGYESIRLFEHLRPSDFAHRPTFLMGGSDATTYLLFARRAGVIGFYGPSIMAGLSQTDDLPEEFRRHIESFLFESWSEYEYASFPSFTHGYTGWNAKDPGGIGKLHPAGDGWNVLQGEAPVEGHLWGGCIEVVEFLKGTRYWPPASFFDEAVLFFETSEEKPPPDRVGYMLRNYGVAGIIGRASALLLGRPKDYTAADVERLHATVRSIVADEFARPDLPVVTNVDFGHTDPKMILPIGGRVRVDPVLKRITLLESPFTDR